MYEIVSLEQAKALDDYVTAHPRGHFMQTSGYGKSRPDYGWQGLLLRDAAGGIRASMALHSHRVKHTNLTMFYTPRGPVFNTIEDFRDIILAAQDICREQGGYLLRIDPWVSASDGMFAQEAARLGFRFNLRQDYSTFQPKNVYQTKLAGLSEQELLARFHPKTRYNIRLAQRRGVTVRQGTGGDLPVFCAMMAETARRDGFACRSQEFFAGFLAGMGENARLLLAEKDGRVLAGMIGVIQGKKAWYVYGCSFDHGREDRPNELLQWEMIRLARDAGCRIYDFRGVEGQPVPENPGYGLHRFKQGFDARFVELVGQLDLPLRPGVYRLIPLAQRFFCQIQKKKPILPLTTAALCAILSISQYDISRHNVG